MEESDKYDPPRVCHACGLPTWQCRCWDDDEAEERTYPTYDDIYPPEDGYR